MSEQSTEKAVSGRPTRDDLIALCERGVVPVDRWYNRDSASAQKQLGEARALLSAGCDFTLSADPASDQSTWWVRITYPGFGHFDWGGEWEDDLFYIPTAERLERRDGDWY